MSNYKAKNKVDKSKFKYIPVVPQSPLDKKFHTLNVDGTYTYHTNYKLIKSIKDLRNLKDSFKDKQIAWDTETTGLNWEQDDIVGFSLALDAYSGIYVPIRHVNRNTTELKIELKDDKGNTLYTKAGKPRQKTVKEHSYTLRDDNLDPEESLDILYEILANSKLVLCHNAEFDFNMLSFEGYDMNKIRFFDTMVLTYMVDPEARGLAGLKPSSKHYLGRYVPEFKDVLGKEDNFRCVAPEDAYFYACSDVANTYGIYQKLLPIVTKTVNEHKNTIVLDNKKYNVITKDNKLIKTFIDYYGHAEVDIDKSVAQTYKEKVVKDLEKLGEEIYSFFGLGTFNLSTGSKEFKEAMASKNIKTGHLTATEKISFGKEGIAVFNKNMRDLKTILGSSDSIKFLDTGSSLDLRSNVQTLVLSRIIKLYGDQYFIIKETANSMILHDKNKSTLNKERFLTILNNMLQEETKKLDILKKVQENSSLNKAVNSYIDKLTKVDKCRIRYKLFGTSSGRLASGNGSKNDKKTKNTYYIDLNAQNLSKPKPAMYKAEKYDGEGNILGWKFTQISDEYAKEHKDTEYIVEGSSPELNIRNCLIAPKGTIIGSFDYSMQELKILSLLSKDSKMVNAFKHGLDLHKQTALLVWGEDKYDKLKRKKAKACNFLAVYGGQEYTLASQLDIPVDEAKFILSKFYESYFEMAQWKERNIKKMYKDKGVVYNMFGRARKLGSYIELATNLDEQRVSDSVLRKAERRVCSHEVQGFAGDMCRYMLIKLYDTFFKYPEHREKIGFLSTIHDEFNFKIAEDSVVEYTRKLEDILNFQMPNAPFPISITLGFGRRFGQCFDFIFSDDTRTELIPKRA